MSRILPYLLLAATLILGGLWWRAEQERQGAEARLSEARQEMEKEKARLAALTEATQPPAETHAPETAKVVRVPTGTDPAPYIRAIEELRTQVGELTRELSTARDEAARSSVRVTEAISEAAKAREALLEAREDAQAARRVADAVQAELKVKSDRLVRVETESRLAQERMAKAESASTKLTAAARELEEINRRRDGYLNTLLRRYRDVTDLFRSVSLNAQTSDAAGAGGGFQAGDLSRIQNAMQQAEDDLRQVQSLNARAAQLTRVK